MARFYKTPVLTPVDYGFKMPYQEIMGVLQRKQKEQDTALATLQKYATDEGPNARQPDFDIRRDFMSQREQRLDKLMFDDNGRLRDFTGMSGEILNEARTRSKEEKAGGTYWALENSYQRELDYIKSIKDNKNIGDDRKNRLIQFSSLRNSQGIGEKDEYGIEDLYGGIVAAKEVNEHKIISDVLKDWPASQIQVSTGLDGEAVVNPTQEQLDQLMAKNSEYKKVLGGDYIQTGTLEYVLVDDLYNEGLKMLSNNTEIMDDISQEAMLLGLTPQQQQLYVKNKLEETAMAVAKEYSKSKFTPKTFDNWRRKKNVDLANGKALIDYEDARKMRTMSVSTGTTQRTMQLGDITNMRKTASDLIKTSTAKIKEEYLNPDGTVKEEVRNNKVRMAEYQDLLAKRSQAMSQVNNANTILSNYMDDKTFNIKDMSIEGVKNTIGDILYDLKFDNIPDEKRTAIKDLYEKDLVPFLEKYDSKTLREHYLAKGSLPEDITNKIQEAQNTLNTLLQGEDINMPYDVANFTEDVVGNITASADTRFEGYVNSNPTQEIPYTSDFTAMRSFSGSGSGFSGILGAYTKEVENIIRLGNGNWINPVTKDEIDPMKQLIEMGGDPSKMQVSAGEKFDDALGTHTYLITSVNKKTGEAIRFQINADQNTSNSLKANFAEIAVQMAESSKAQESNTSKIKDHRRSTLLLGQNRFATEIQTSLIEHSVPGSKVFLDNNNFVLVKTPENYYALYPTKKVGNRMVADTQRPITDFRKYSDTQGTPIFKSLNEVYQLLGEGVLSEEMAKRR
jgi:hypothetical protein